MPDRIIAATASRLNLPFVTRDQRTQAAWDTRPFCKRGVVLRLARSEVAIRDSERKGCRAKKVRKGCWTASLEASIKNEHSLYLQAHAPRFVIRLGSTGSVMATAGKLVTESASQETAAMPKVS